MAGVLPGAADITTHWDNRADGVVSISRFTKEEMLDAGVDEETVNDPRYVNARGFVDASTFDADFFGYSARDAETMDPQMRLLHETTRHALEDAGYVPTTIPVTSHCSSAAAPTSRGWPVSSTVTTTRSGRSRR